MNDVMVFLATKFLDAAKFTTLTPLSLLMSCELSFQTRFENIFPTCFSKNRRVKALEHTRPGMVNLVHFMGQIKLKNSSGGHAVSYVQF
jgi:hypothetical protein